MDESSRARNAPSEDIQPLANSGRGPLQVPGFGGIPIHYELPPDARFAHGNEEWRQAPAVTARELAMLAVMNRITDHYDWHVHVFNDEIVAQWRDEAFQVTKLMSEKAWDWCVEELRDKAAYFRENQHIRVLEAGSCVCKSDTPSLQSLSALFREAVPSLLKPQHMSQNLDRRSDQVLSLVDPSLFPLVHGRSLVFINGGEVDLDDIFGSYKDSMVAPSHYDRRVDSLMLQRDIEKHGPLPTGHSTDTTRHEVYRWSPNYQRLPCEVEFLGDSGTEIRVNGDLMTYGIVDSWGPFLCESLRMALSGTMSFPNGLSRSECLQKPGSGIYRELKEAVQSSIADQSKKGKKKHDQAQIRLANFIDVAGKEDMELPPLDSDLWQRAKDYLARPENESNSAVQVPDDWVESPFDALEKKVHRIIDWTHPEPGTAFSYHDWKTNQHNDKPIIEIVRLRSSWDLHGRNCAPITPGHTPYTLTLQDTFRRKGLQVIVEMENIELTPSTPIYHSDAWKIEGQLNDHIVGTAVFAYDIKNITTPRISFRQYTVLFGEYYRYNEQLINRGEYTWRNRPGHRYGKRGEQDAMEEILGFPPLYLSSDMWGNPPVQGTGSVEIPQGRLVTFPSG